MQPKNKNKYKAQPLDLVPVSIRQGQLNRHLYPVLPPHPDGWNGDGQCATENEK